MLHSGTHFLDHIKEINVDKALIVGHINNTWVIDVDFKVSNEASESKN
jgi:hypothetical protein